jgi:hypothetical protein
MIAVTVGKETVQCLILGGCGHTCGLLPLTSIDPLGKFPVGQSAVVDAKSACT